MAKNITKYSVFLASPSDLSDERFLLEDVISELNNTFGRTNNVIIELLKWETHSAPGISLDHPQKLINKDIGDEYDIFIGILWKRFGTPTDSANSGTEEEYLNALNRYKKNNLSPQILFYFKTSVPKLLSEINADELKKVEDFKKKLIADKCLYWEFNSTDDLAMQLRMHLPRRISDLMEQSQQITTNTQSEVAIADTSNSEDEDLGLFDYADLFETLLKDSLLSVTRITESTEWIGKEINEKANELTRISQANPNRAIITQHLKRAANILNDYSQRLSTESPIFYQNFEEAIKAGINIVNLYDDIKSDSTIQDLEDVKENTVILIEALPIAIKSMTGFSKAIESLPRIQVDINKAKKQLMIQLEDFILKLENALELSNDFYKELSFKIHKITRSLTIKD
jgi:hypothetical protein